MTFYQILMLALLTNLCLVDQIPAQSSHNNVSTVKNIYDAIQKKDISTLHSELVTKMKGYNTILASEAYDRYHITLPAILQNHWEQVTVKHLQIEEMDGEVVMATGELAGRQASNCVLVITKFHHVWLLKDGNIIEFKKNQ